MQYTAAQEEAIFDKEHDILISAAAGSGKTRVLIDRIVQLIVSGQARLNQMLIVTFTNAAASEMRSRLEARLDAFVPENPEEEHYVDQAIQDLPTAHISTMHAFCIRVLRAYFKEANVSPTFRMLSATKQSVLQKEALDKVLEEAYEDLDDGFSELVLLFGGHLDDQHLRQLIYKLANFLSGHPSPEAWLEKIAWNAEHEEDCFIHLFIDIAKEKLELADQYLHQMRMLAESDELFSSWLETVEDDQYVVQTWRRFIADVGSHSVEQKPATNWSRLKAIRGKKDAPPQKEEIKEEFKAWRDRLKHSIDDIDKLLPYANLIDIWEDRKATQRHFEALLRLVKNYERYYCEAKEKENLLDFNDVEHKMLQLIGTPSQDESILLARESLKKSLTHIFFDEYQDASPIQEAIVEAFVDLAKNTSSSLKLFFVGDVKQAIYRFRLADPQIFNTRYRRYATSTNGIDKLIHLDKNFRSSQAVLTVCNQFFSKLMTEQLGEVDYTSPGQSLVCGNTEEAVVPAHLVLFDKAEDGPTEAEWIAKEVLRLHKEEHIPYRDIAILLRSPKQSLPHYIQALQEEEIPFFADNTLVTFRQTEVLLFFNLLKIIHNDQDDVALLSVLLSPFCGFTEEEVAILRIREPDLSFWQAFYEAADTYVDAIGQKARSFIARLQAWRNSLSRLQGENYAYELLHETGYEAYLLAQKKGVERYHNVHAFIKLVHMYMQESHDGLAGFLEYAEVLMRDESDTLSPAKEFSESMDAVRIMSIHKSKGLEFPVVFIAELGKQFNTQDLMSPLMLDADLGVALEYRNIHTNSRHHTFHQCIMREKKRKELLSEEMRLLYVAMTRAVSRLYLLGSHRKLEKYCLAKAQDISILQAEAQQGQMMLHWWLLLLPALFSADDLETAWQEGIVKSSSANLPLYLHLIRSREAATEILVENDPILVAQDADSSNVDEIEANLFGDYRYSADTKKPFKATVSQIAKKNRLEDPIVKPWAKASFLKDATEHDHTSVEDAEFRYTFDGVLPLRATDIGTALHKLMANWPLRVLSDEESKAYVHQQIQNGYIDAAYQQNIDPTLLNAFFQSALGQQVLEAPIVERERSFTMQWHDLLINGQIDLFFGDDQALHLVDFKSDQHIAPERYYPQLQLYKEALEKAYGRPVKSCWLYWIRHRKATLIPSEVFRGSSETSDSMDHSFEKSC